MRSLDDDYNELDNISLNVRCLRVAWDDTLAITIVHLGDDSDEGENKNWNRASDKASCETLSVVECNSTQQGK